jgi:hypothetical protein
VLAVHRLDLFGTRRRGAQVARDPSGQSVALLELARLRDAQAGPPSRVGPGLPTTIDPGGISPRTTVSAPTMQSSPIRAPARITAPAPTNTRLPIVVRAIRVQPVEDLVLASWASTIVPAVITQSSPTSMSHGCPVSNTTPRPMYTR